MNGPVTARDLIKAASAGWVHDQAQLPEWWPARTPVSKTPLELLDSGLIGHERFWAIVNQCAPCGCWSCDRQCGGAATEDSCGLVKADENGHPICAACREKADVIDTQHRGARVSVDQGRVRLNPDVWGSYSGVNLWLTPASARRLAARLITCAQVAETVWPTP